MGEARRRGSFEERKKQSIERKAAEAINRVGCRRPIHCQFQSKDKDPGRPVRPHRSGGGIGRMGRASAGALIVLSAACVLSSRGFKK